MGANGRGTWLLAAALTAVAAVLPLAFLRNQYNLILLTTVALYGVLTSAWNIIGGMAGQLDLSAGAYLGLGAYTTATLLLRWNITPWVGMFAGGVVAMGFAFLVGFPLFRFRIREVWYALSSSALVVVLQVVFLLWKQVGGPMERLLPSAKFSLYNLRFQSYLPYYYIMLVLLLAHPVHHLPHPHPAPGLLPAGPGRQRRRGRGPGGGRPGQQAEGPGDLCLSGRDHRRPVRLHLRVRAHQLLLHHHQHGGGHPGHRGRHGHHLWASYRPR